VFYSTAVICAHFSVMGLGFGWFGWLVLGLVWFVFVLSRLALLKEVVNGVWLSFLICVFFKTR
jgi:hypothetical protein